MNNLYKLCSSCENCKSITINGNLKKPCNQDFKSAYKAFTEQKHIILKDNANSKFETYKQSFCKFIYTFRDCEIESKLLINSVLSETIQGDVTFSAEFYKKIDLYIAKWDSWFSRFSLYLKILMVNGYICSNITTIIKTTMQDYNEMDIFGTRIDDKLIEYLFKFIDDLNIKTPVENGEYSDALLIVHSILLFIYRIILLQFIQEDRMMNGGDIFYYHSYYRKLSKEFEDYLIDYRVEYLINKYGSFKVIMSDTSDSGIKLEDTKLINYIDKIIK